MDSSGIKVGEIGILRGSLGTRDFEASVRRVTSSTVEVEIGFGHRHTLKWNRATNLLHKKCSNGNVLTFVPTLL